MKPLLVLSSLLRWTTDPFMTYNPSRGELARPPGNSAEGIPETVAWIIVIVFGLLAWWLYSITPRKRPR
ncbi:MAG: hypothetical protein ACO1NQ_01200 [Flavobacteriales bacterium]